MLFLIVWKFDVFKFEGVNLAIVVEESMQHPEEYPKMLDSAMLVVAILYFTFSIGGRNISNSYGL